MWPIMSASVATPASETRRTAWRDGWWRRAAGCPSPNFNHRPDACEVTLAVLHSISLPPGRYGGDGIERLFTNRLDWEADPYYRGIRGLEVSAHFLIRRRGELLQFVSCDDRAWHAGHSSWHGRGDCNDFSVGIELEGLEGERFEDVQYRTLAGLLRALALRYPVAEVVGHEHVAPTRKRDPGQGFDWSLLAKLLRWRAERLPFAPTAASTRVRR